MSLSVLIGNAIDLFYVGVVRRVVSPTLFRYGACGALNMALDAVWYFLIYHFVVCKQFVDLGFVTISPHILSLIIVFPITFITGFLLNRYVAFQAMAYRTRGQLIRYAISVAGAILLNYALMKLFVEACDMWPTPSKVITTIISSLYSFVAAKYFTFRKS